MREFFLAARTFVLAASDYECGGLVVLFLPGKEMIVGRRLLAHSPRSPSLPLGQAATWLAGARGSSLRVERF